MLSPDDLNYAPIAGLGGQGSYASLAQTLPTSAAGLDFKAPGMGSSIDNLAAQIGNQGKLGFNVPTVNMALQGIGTIGSLWAGFKQLGLAKEKFNYEKGVTDTNLANSIKSYNTALEDRARSRAFTEGRSQDEANAYVEKNKMTRS
jgi:hypothetical protein